MIEKTIVMDKEQMNRALYRISHEILERNKGTKDLVLIGIITRGVPMAERIKNNILKIEGVEVPCDKIDISLYRDDLSEVAKDPVVEEIPNIDVKNKTVILVDDVIYTGRTTRAAIEAVLKLGRPKRIELAVLIDRGHRELPIRPDYIGKNIPTSRSEIVSVKFMETDNIERVSILE